ncbi:MAG TPA: glutamate--tRNA ligase [Thermotogota bacterium]|nr:glutamate--tRNA ligase [Thermotogota bacterium]HPJ87649.1 glutamate--tRNA ligase [Thermotogota bacterium]HPR94913.1 glutamate--tRNA ligase [Thermotogota bacterium]
MVRVRFAPSPTGYLHVGGARTALFNYLYAKHNDGEFILRIEDTDVERSTKESEDSLIETMKWLGFQWDEGPDNGGEYGPYRQSERDEIYVKKAYELVERGLAYEAYVYPEELEHLREEMLSEKISPHYDEEMLSAFDTPERRKEYVEKGLKPVIYFKMPKKDYTLNDLIKGAVTFKEGTIGDFVILRSSGLPTYNFAVVVDDALMKITHVIRGDDHLSNTLRQLAVFEGLGFELPAFAHVSMILGPDGSRLSKRHGATSVEKYREMGYLPESVMNYLALLSWSHPDEKDIMSMDEMIKSFTIERVNSSAAIYDEQKLRWMNGVYIRELDDDVLARLAIPYIVAAGQMTQVDADANYKWVREAVVSVKKKIHQFDEVPAMIAVFFKEPTFKIEWTKQIKEDDTDPAFIELYHQVKAADSWDIPEIYNLFKRVTKAVKVSNKKFYHMLRVVLTGEEDGPELVNIIHLIGRNQMIQRLERVVDTI